MRDLLLAAEGYPPLLCRSERQRFSWVEQNPPRLLRAMPACRLPYLLSLSASLWRTFWLEDSSAWISIALFLGSLVVVVVVFAFGD